MTVLTPGSILYADTAGCLLSSRIISGLAPKLRTTNTTTGGAMILAQETYTDAEKRFGSDAQAVLESYQPGQDPKRFLDGFQNAYLAGMMGSSVALNNSSAVAYLTQEQREVENGGELC